MTTPDRRDDDRMVICMVGNAGAVHVQRWARAMVVNGHTVHILSVRDAAIDGVKVHPHERRMRCAPRSLAIATAYFRLWWALPRLLRSIMPDVVHAHYTTTNGLIAAARRTHPLVVSVWGTDIRQESNIAKRWLRHSANRLVLSRADAVTVTSTYLAHRVSRIAGQAQSTELIPFGVDIDVFSPKRCSLKGEHVPRIGFIKHLEKKYGPETLLQAVASLRRAGIETEVVLAGDGTEQASLESLASNLEIADRTDFIGVVPHEGVPDLLCSIDVLANPSLEESFGVIILEASSMGVPVVATRVGGTAEVVDDGTTGVLVDPNDAEALASAIASILSDPALSESMGSKGRQFVADRYRWSDSIAAMEGVYESVLAKQRESPAAVSSTVAGRVISLARDRWPFRRMLPALRVCWRWSWRQWFRLRALFAGPYLDLALDGLTVTIDTRDSGVSQLLYWFHEYEPGERAVIRSLLQPGMTAVDVGAHLGYHTMLMSRLAGSTGHVLAIEASPRTHVLLKRNITQNGLKNTTTRGIAASDHCGELQFVSPLRGNTGTAHAAGKGEIGTHTVPCEALDVVLDELSLTPDLIKIDVEGTELAVLRGLRRSLSMPRPPILLCELNPSALRRNGTNPQELLRFLGKYGYEFSKISPSGQLTRTRPSELALETPLDGNVNFVATHPSSEAIA